MGNGGVGHDWTVIVSCCFYRNSSNGGKGEKKGKSTTKRFVLEGGGLLIITWILHLDGRVLFLTAKAEMLMRNSMEVAVAAQVTLSLVQKK